MNKEKVSKEHKKYRERIRLECLVHYGGDPPKCACCGETLIEFLTIDHINGGGVKHRKEAGITGTFFYNWLKKQGYPQKVSEFYVIIAIVRLVIMGIVLMKKERECFANSDSE